MRKSFIPLFYLGPLLLFSACATKPQKQEQALTPRAEADYHFIVAELSGHDGSSQEAIARFQKVLALDHTATSVRLRLASEYLNAGDIENALTQGKLAVKNDSQNMEAHLFLAGLYSANKENDLAIAEYQLALNLQPHNEEAHAYIGSLYADQKNNQKARFHFQALLKIPHYATPEVAYYYLGLIQPQPEKSFKKALELKPDYEEAALSLAHFYLEQKNPDKAITLCLDYQKKNRFSLQVSDLIAQIYIEMGKAENAYEQLQFIADNSKPSIDIDLKMALLLIEQKKFHQAGLLLKDIVTRYPTSDSARFYLAAVYEESGQNQEALKEYLLISTSSEHFNKASLHTAYLFEKQSDYLGASRALEKGLAKSSQDPNLLFQYALVLDQLGKKDGMIRQMKKLVEVAPQHVQGLSYLAFSLAELNQQLSDAEAFARKALALQPADAYVLDTLGWVLYKQKRFSESVQILEQAHKAQSSASIIAEHLADAYLMHSMTEKAKIMYNKAASLTTDESHASQIRNKILNLSF